MAEAQLKQQLDSLQSELANLRMQVRSSVANPTVSKDLSLVSFIPKWSVTDKSVTVNEFFEIVDSTAKVGNWSEKDKIKISVLRLTDIAKSFYSGCIELHQ
jgi:hypothetical protein